VKSPQPNPKLLARSPILRRMDQAAVAALTLLALSSIGMYWLVQGGTSGRLIEIDRAPRQTASFRIEINEADWPELSLLPGVGETLARRIVESRSAQGRFADLDDLRRVRGIGPKTLERIRPFLRPLPPAANVAGQ
jgi:competence protein ComEA